ncbi:MAG TPA: DinB family protein [Thermoanaerobaculia bacterium]|nr:DinB family protein [Thermoanaerobaculia bacterium]
MEILRQDARDAFAQIERAIDDVPEGLRERSHPGRWSPHEILDHLVLSHAPAPEYFSTLLDGISHQGEPIPAGLHRPASERPSWNVLREELHEIHRRTLAVLDTATDEHSLDPTIGLEMVVKVRSKPVHWIEPLDWKALVQAMRLHTLEHLSQLQRAVTTGTRP